MKMHIFNRFRSNSEVLRPEGTSQPSSASAPTYLIDEKAPSPLAIIYRSEIDYISRCVLDYPNIETGGQLFGFWTSQGAPVVLYVIGPGRNANHQPAFFNQDIEYLDRIGNELLSRYALQHIGEWHSHHQLGLARPSGHDARTMFHGIQSTPLRRLLLCICNYENGRATINPYTFHENHMHSYTDAMWQIKEMESPFRKPADKALERWLIHPHTQQAVYGSLRTVRGQEAAMTRNATVQFSSQYWLMHPGNIDTMKQMVTLIKAKWPQKETATQASQEGLVQINVNNGEFIYRFPKHFPQEAPLYIIRGKKWNAPQWNAPQDDSGILESFHHWINEIKDQMGKI